jgi:hypothetical protein
MYASWMRDPDELGRSLPLSSQQVRARSRHTSSARIRLRVEDVQSRLPATSSSVRSKHGMFAPSESTSPHSSIAGRGRQVRRVQPSGALSSPSQFVARSRRPGLTGTLRSVEGPPRGDQISGAPPLLPLVRKIFVSAKFEFLSCLGAAGAVDLLLSRCTRLAPRRAIV